ncbi:hypothetical protein ACU686_04145 [Yinghuangia aomiensis]
MLPEDEARRIVEELDAAEAQALADERHASGAVGAARNTSDPSVLRELADHPDAAVRGAVAGNDETPGDVVAALLWEPGRPPFRVLPDEEPEEAAAGIRRAAARHDGLPPSEFGAAARHPDRDVRGIIAQRLDIGVELLSFFARDASPFIRGLTLHHRALPVALLRELADDPEESCARRCCATPPAPSTSWSSSPNAPPTTSRTRPLSARPLPPSSKPWRGPVRPACVPLSPTTRAWHPRLWPGWSPTGTGMCCSGLRRIPG